MVALVPANSFSPEQERFALWLALPEVERRPRLQKDLAEVLGVHEITLCKWKHLPGFAAEVVKLTRELVLTTDVARIVRAQVDKALSGDTTAAKMVLDFAGAGAAAAVGPSGGLDDSAGSAAGAAAQASASAQVFNVTVNGADVDEETARRVASRKLLEQFTVKASEGDE